MVETIAWFFVSFFSLAALVLAIGYFFAKRFEQDFPDFVVNEVGGVLQYAGYADYRKAAKEGKTKGGHVIVSDVLCFGRSALNDNIMGKIEWDNHFPYPPVTFPGRARKEIGMFVAFASTCHMTLGQQLATFKVQSVFDASVWAEQKIDENAAAFWQVRFYRLWNTVFDYFPLTLLLLLVSIGVGCISTMVRWDGESKSERVVVAHLTTSAGLERIEMTGEEKRTALVKDELARFIFKGEIVAQQEIDGGFYRIRIRTGEGKSVQHFDGMSNRRHSMGEVIFLRRGDFMYSPEVHGSSVKEAWEISGEHAKLLQGVGFKLIE